MGTHSLGSTVCAAISSDEHPRKGLSLEEGLGTNRTPRKMGVHGCPWVSTLHVRGPSIRSKPSFFFR